MNLRRIVLGLFVLTVLTVRQTHGADLGQPDLDKAVDAQVVANSADDLAEVIKHCENAIQKGLNDDNKKFADQLLASTLTLRGELYSNQIFNPPGDQRWQRLREMAVADLERAVELAPGTARVYVTIGRLHGLPGGSREKAVKALTKAIELKDEDASLMQRALVLRAELSDDAAQRLADLNAAAELDPKDTDVLQLRGAYYLDQRKLDEAINDFNEAIKLAPEDARSYHALGIAQLMQEKLDDAIVSFTKAIELAPENTDYLAQRARTYSAKQDVKAAVADLDKLLEINPLDVNSILLRASNYAQDNQNEKALADIDESLKIQPGHLPAIQMRALLLARMEKVPEAIAELEKVREQNPTDLTCLTQLGVLYNANQQIDKAVETFGEVLKQDPKNNYALQARADAYLTLGNHAEAIADYNRGIEIAPEDTGILNNLAWVLATSPKDELRDPKRALKLATKACEETQYQQAHILSTLAAAYAENGDFAKAVEWSKKAVEMSSETIKAPLKKELSSYEAGKPWREVKTGDAAPAE
jgi:tetratricopeptide (TPR) repeat protein